MDGRRRNEKDGYWIAYILHDILWQHYQQMELGFSYDDANVCDKIADIEIPVLVINSEADTLTPQFMGQEIYDSIQNEEIKMIWTVTDSEHTEMWLDYNQEYREKVQELLNFTK